MGSGGGGTSGPAVCHDAGMAPRGLAALTVTVLTVVALAGCGGEEPDAVSPASAPSPDAAQSAELIGLLGEIDPTLGEEKSVSRARDMCATVLRVDAGEPAHPTLSLEDIVRTRFTAEHLTDEQALQVVDAIRAGGWCA